MQAGPLPGPQRLPLAEALVHAPSGDAEQPGERERLEAGGQPPTRDCTLRQIGSVRNERSLEQDPQVVGDVLGDALDQAAHVQKTGGRSRRSAARRTAR